MAEGIIRGSVSESQIIKVKNYIANQEEHHKTKTGTMNSMNL